MSSTKELAYAEMPCTSRSLKWRLRRGQVVECLLGPTDFERWTRIANVRCDLPPHWVGLWVQQFGGLWSWQRPKGDKARYRLLQDSEMPNNLEAIG